MTTETTAGTAGATHKYVTFVAGDEVFAVDMAPVQEIIRVPDVVRVPLAPPALLGMANLRGNVLPILSLRRSCGLSERQADDATRALVVDHGQPLGFVVDRVVSVIDVDATHLEAVEQGQGSIDASLLSGVLKDVAGHPMILVLDFAKLIARELASLHNGQRANAADGGAATAVQASVATDELQLVSFEVDGQEYAIAIEDVQEIVQVPSHIVRVPHAKAHVLGVMTLRNRLLPLVSLRRMFGLAPRDADERSRIVVVSLGAASVGVVMDSVNEVLRVPKRSVQDLPAMLAREDALSDITGLCQLDGGRRLVSIVSARQLFRHSAVQEALSQMEAPEGPPQESVASRGAEGDQVVVVFRLGREEYGVSIDSVQEIVRVPDTLAHVPKAPAYVEGVINLRGAVLPVIDLRSRLGLAPVDRHDGQRIMVFLIAGTRTGFIVDSVAEVLKIPASALEPAPRLSAEHGQLLPRVANLQKLKRMVQLLEPAQLLDGVNVGEH